MLNLAANCRLVEAAGYDRDLYPTGYAIARGATVRVKARRLRVVEREIVPPADQWIVEVPLVEYHPAFDSEDRFKLRDWGRVEPHPDLTHPWYKLDKDGLIYFRSRCDIDESEWQELVRFCDRLYPQVGQAFTLTREGIKVGSSWWKPNPNVRIY